ncbi:MAG: DUF72 domain-containing protein [Acidobacteria bacterium]|jgi:uncharacterized protein YecE (DUF72 family)|nr:DUF72 domain-containing protein [Acidobacteriota bacterium]
MLHVGTSGWVYKHWVEIFYPKEMNSHEYLKFYAREFKSAEINSSFYHLPTAETFAKWKDLVPAEFIFSVKVSRFITHIKRMKNIDEPWERFYNNAAKLGEKLGPFLLQFPRTFKLKPENLERLEYFFNMTGIRNKFAFEFRDESWNNEQAYELLKKYDSAWVIADSPAFPKSETVTAKFVYIRMHGAGEKYDSHYTLDHMKTLAGNLKKYLEQDLDVYVYFNNDSHGYALDNARQVLSLMNEENQ